MEWKKKVYILKISIIIVARGINRPTDITHTLFITKCEHTPETFFLFKFTMFYEFNICCYL